MDWPNIGPQRPHRLIVPQLSEGIIAPSVAWAAGAVWSANLGVAFPFVNYGDRTVASIEVQIDTSNGNIDVGIYSEGWKLLRAMGGGAMGAAGVQNFNITDLRLPPGRFHFAVSSSSASAKLIECTPIFGASASGAAMIGAKQMAAAYPLPATFVPATPTRTTLPGAALIFS